MTINSIEIKTLFGHFSYSIELMNNITIIHGPNGCGKTTVLKMINYLFSDKFSLLNKIEFSEFVVCFSDGQILTIKKDSNNIQIDNDILIPDEIRQGFLLFELTNDSGVKQYTAKDALSTLLNKNNSSNMMKVRRLIPFIEQVANDKWLDIRQDRTLSFSELIEQYGDFILSRSSDDLFFKKLLPSDITSLLDSIKVRFISADRLTVEKREKRSTYGEEISKFELKVDICAQDISTKIKYALQEYANLSQSRDRSFPVRVLRERDILSIPEIKEKLVVLENKRKRFIETGILTNEEQNVNIDDLVSTVTENTQVMLSLYTKDTEEKLSILDKLSESITLFGRLIDDKYENQKIIFDKDCGFKFRSTHSGKIIEAEKLSSGEQHELVLLYDLIFNTDSKTLVLIDEPELSLHIKWQYEFIDNMQEIIKISGFKALIATHSPQIVDNRWSMTTKLTKEA